jgi:hypothetical protein
MTAGDILERWGRPVEVLRIPTPDGGVREEWRYRHGRLGGIGPASRLPVFVWRRQGRVVATLE